MHCLWKAWVRDPVLHVFSPFVEKADQVERSADLIQMSSITPANYKNEDDGRVTKPAGEQALLEASKDGQKEAA